MGMTLERFASYTTQCPTESIEHTLDTMRADEAMLREAGQDHIADFLTMYATATAGVLETRDRDGFKEPEQLALSVANFEFWFKEPVLHLAAGDTHKIRPAWRPLLLGKTALAAHPINRQMAGMIAHVEADLPDSAVASNAVHNEAYMAADWDLVNDILRTAAHQLSERSVTLPKALESVLPKIVQREVRHFVTDQAMTVIEHKRDVARVKAFSLRDAPNDIERSKITAKIDSDAETHAHAMLRGSRSMARHFLRALI